MATSQSFVDFVIDQITDAGVITAKKMFGEYALYSDKKVIAFICDNQLLIKPTEQGREYIGDVSEAQAYPGSKMYFLVNDKIDDTRWLSELVRVTAAALPEPKPKVKKKKVLK